MTLIFKCISTRSGKSLILSINNQKYLFNCFEGFQRYCIESKTKLMQFSMIFLPTKESTIPFIGTFLTLSEMGKKTLNIFTLHKDLFVYSEKFAHRSNFHVNLFTEKYEDTNVEITAIKDGIYLNTVIQIKPIRGQLNIDKANFHRVPKEKLKLLCIGEEILVDGKTFTDKDFLGDGHVFELMAIIFNEENVNLCIAFDNVKIFFCFSIKIAEIIKAKYHAKVYILSENNAIEYESMYNILKDLNAIYGNYHVPLGQEVTESDNLCLFNGDTISYSKKTKEFRYHKTESIKYPASAIKVDSELKRISTNSKVDSKHNIIFLGTGAAIPCKYRNVSSILVQHKNTYFVLDSGEDTYFNILRFYGNDHILSLIDCIFISHSHADHHLGLTTLLINILKKKSSVRVICPGSVKEFVNQFITEGINYYLTDSIERPKTLFNSASLDITKYTLQLDFGYKITVIPVVHCSDSCGIRLDLSEYSVSYSGDCRPSPLFGSVSKKCDVMIHEATFEDKLLDKAHKTKHSTISEAISVFEQSKAIRLILTHFSQRYPKKMENMKKKSGVMAFDFFRYDVFGFDEKKYQDCQNYFEALDEDLN